MLEAVERVLLEEREQFATPSDHKSDPLMHLMHGRPGVGKSHVLEKIREFFEYEVEYRSESDYHYYYQLVNFEITL